MKKIRHEAQLSGKKRNKSEAGTIIRERGTINWKPAQLSGKEAQ
ncbi:hypothetical protein [Bacillus haikouensis]|nr:hypothetical protein [Bacillus haikouensis]